MTADKRQTLDDSCPKQEVEAEETCGPCDSTDCDAGCDSCE